MLASSVGEFKLFSAALIWALALLGGFGPLLLLRHQGDKATSINNSSKTTALLTSVLNMFAGGIFLSSACLHLLPDAQANEALATWFCDSEGKDCFQWANFFFGAGFLLVLLVEVSAHALQHKMSSAHNDYEQEHTSEVQELTPLLTSDHTRQHQLSVRDHHRRHESCSSQETDASSSPHARSHSKDGSSERGHSHRDHDIEIGSHSDRWLEEPTTLLYGSTTVSNPNKHQQPQTDASTNKQRVDLEVSHSHAHHNLKDAKPLLACVVFLALSFHSIMEGMGLGASDHAAWDILVAVLAHKSLAAFALTQELLQHRVSQRRVLTSIGVFSAMTPVGTLLGWLLVKDTTTESMSSGVCSALAGGTFLFVAVMEVIPQELRDQQALVAKCSALLAGFGAMGVLSIWT